MNRRSFLGLGASALVAAALPDVGTPTCAVPRCLRVVRAFGDLCVVHGAARGRSMVGWTRLSCDGRVCQDPVYGRFKPGEFVAFDANLAYVPWLTKETENIYGRQGYYFENDVGLSPAKQDTRGPIGVYGGKGYVQTRGPVDYAGLTVIFTGSHL